MINPQWLELPMSRTNLHGAKDVHIGIHFLPIVVSFYLGLQNYITKYHNSDQLL